LGGTGGEEKTLRVGRRILRALTKSRPIKKIWPQRKNDRIKVLEVKKSQTGEERGRPIEI